jgi:rubrerythrin
VDARRLRLLADEVDEEHRAAMASLPAEIERKVLGRRSLVGAAFGGVAAGVAGAAVAIPSLAAAQESTTTVSSASTTSAAATSTSTATTVAPTTTTAPPQQPSNADKVLMAFAQSLELALVAAYGTAAAEKKLDASVATVFATFASHHREHGQSFAAYAGKAATGTANQTLVADLTRRLRAARDQADVLRIALEVEQAAAASYASAIGQLEGTDPSTVVAAILPIEASHAVVIGEALGLDIQSYTPSFQTTDGAVTASRFPIVER